jgi:hypothetical protein
MWSTSSCNGNGVVGWGVGLSGVLLLVIACRKETTLDRRPIHEAEDRASAEPTRAFRPPPRGAFVCDELRPPPSSESTPLAETIEVTPPGAGKKIVMSKTGVVVTFDRNAFLKAARCMKLEKAVKYIEEETGFLEESVILDAFQLSYVAAALLDAGRASVRPEAETASRKSFVRDGWAADGCNGRCRSFGRLYRLSADDPSFFLRVTDNGRDDWK